MSLHKWCLKLEIEWGLRLILLNICVFTYSIRRYYSKKIQITVGYKIAQNSQPKDAQDYESKYSVAFRAFLHPTWVVALALFFWSPTYLAWTVLPFPQWLRFVGLGLAFVCLPFLIWVQHTLGRHWSVHLKLIQDHQLVTKGPYKYIRHPMYVVLFLFIVAVGLFSASILIAALNILLVAVYFKRITKEEQMMLKRFGSEYGQYMERTGRFFPKIFA